MADWYAASKGQQFGPVDAEQIRAWLRERRLAPQDYAWREGMDNWTPLEQVSEFSDALVCPVGGPAPFGAPAVNTSVPAGGEAAPDKIPGGLITLAVLNFVFGAFGVLGAIGGVIGWLLASSMLNSRNAPNMPPGLDRFGWGMVLVSLVSLIVSTLGIVAGVGYLKRSRRLGLNMGNIYGVAGLLLVVLNFIQHLSGQYAGGLVVGPAVPSIGLACFGALFGLIYPLLTLILLNTVLKKHFR